jgi:hypothetical protein
MFPNSGRPGVGQPPRREGSRPMLPQHARHCPVLEAGSTLGFMVFAPLEPHESYYIEFQGEGQYLFTYFQNNRQQKWDAIFSVAVILPVGGIGMMREEVKFAVKDPPVSMEEAKLIMRAFVVPEDLGTPAGAVTLRGATNFQTPEGWDSVYTPVFNMIERPVAAALIVRVETDWYAHESEFRYVLQPGEGIPGAHTMPIGQVFFVPREEITLRPCNEEELARIRQSKEEFTQKKAEHKITTPYGLQYSPHYLQQSRSKKP